MILSHLTAPLAALARGAALAAVLALPAAAATMQAVYSGNIEDGWDSAGVFGEAEVSLSNMQFFATFRYDTSLGTINDGEGSQELIGGTGYGSASPIFYAAITINGVTRTFDLIESSRVHLSSRPDGSGLTGTNVSHSADGTNLLQVRMGTLDGSFPVPLDLTQPFTGDIFWQSGLTSRLGGFHLRDYDQVTGTYTTLAQGYLLVPVSIDVTVISAVPLPAGLPLLAFSLGGLAVVARRRRVSAA